MGRGTDPASDAADGLLRDLGAMERQRIEDEGADLYGRPPAWVREVEAALPDPGDHEACAAWVAESLQPFTTTGLGLALVEVIYGALGVEVDPEPLDRETREAMDRLLGADVIRMTDGPGAGEAMATVACDDVLRVCGTIGRLGEDAEASQRIAKLRRAGGVR